MQVLLCVLRGSVRCEVHPQLSDLVGQGGAARRAWRWSACCGRRCQQTHHHLEPSHSGAACHRHGARHPALDPRMHDAALAFTDQPWTHQLTASMSWQLSTLSESTKLLSDRGPAVQQNNHPADNTVAQPSFKADDVQIANLTGAAARIQVLLAVYFFLAGIAVSQRRLLMLTPICTAICSLVLSAATTLSAWLLPAYRHAPFAGSSLRRPSIRRDNETQWQLALRDSASASRRRPTFYRCLSLATEVWVQVNLDG